MKADIYFPPAMFNIRLRIFGSLPNFSFSTEAIAEVNCLRQFTVFLSNREGPHNFLKKF